MCLEGHVGINPNPDLHIDDVHVLHHSSLVPRLSYQKKEKGRVTKYGRRAEKSGHSEREPIIRRFVHGWSRNYTWNRKLL